MDDTEGVTTPPTLDSVLTAMAEILRAAGYTVTKPLPAKVRDCEGDIWHLCSNGKYRLHYGDGAWTLEELSDEETGFGPVKVVE